MVSPLQQSGLGQVSQGNPEYGTRDVPFTRSGIAEAFRTNPFLNALISGKGLATELREQKQKPLDLMQADAEMIDIDASPISSALGSFNSAIGEGVPGLLIADQIAQADAGMTDIDSGISSDIAQLQQDLGEKKKAQVEDQGIAPDVALDEVSRGEAPEAPQDEQLSPLDKAFEDAMSEYENINAGEETPRKTLAEYKKDFADATGIDVSGKVDKSAALQAFGLALMQNQAGKGFNVSKLLTSLGEAGEKASPKLEKARERARTAQLAAGKYGLEQVAADDATEIAARVAQKKALNELNNTNLDNKSKAIIKQAELDNDMAIARLENKTKLREASIAANEAPDLYTDKTEQQVLFPGADESFQVSAYVADGNTLA